MPHQVSIEDFKDYYFIESLAYDSTVGKKLTVGCTVGKLQQYFYLHFNDEVICYFGDLDAAIEAIMQSNLA